MDIFTNRKLSSMLAVCIPVFNTDVTRLVNELSRQKDQLEYPVEIILIDDGSDVKFKKINEQVKSKVKYILLDRNIGRSKIRNLFLKYTQSEYLLFIDNDLLIMSDNYISNYISLIEKENNNVVCGGHVYDFYPPSRDKLLRWKYGTTKESQPVELRNKHPYRSFMTGNFLIKRKILEEIPFDARVTGYGHEDTLFGFQLKRRGINIKHVHNPVLSKELDDNAEYLRKTEQGILNLIKVLAYADHDPGFIEDVTLLRVYYKLSSYRLIWIVSILFRLTRSLLKRILLRGVAGMRLFGFYKLGVLVVNYRK